jgi:SSS family solute:Na+ symporter
VVYHAGPLSNLFFLKHNGQVAVEYISDIDKIIPTFINEAMPNWFTALFMLSILSASMSTLSSQFHVMGTSAASDIYADVVRKKENRSITSLVKIGVLVSILISYVICYTLKEGVIARGTAIFMGLCAATFLPGYFCMLYWKKTTAKAVLWSMLAGAGASLFALLFLHQKEAAAIGLCQALFGRPVLIEAYPWPVIDPILFALPLSIVVIVLLSLLGHKKEQKSV